MVSLNDNGYCAVERKIRSRKIHMMSFEAMSFDEGLNSNGMLVKSSIAERRGSRSESILYYDVTTV